MVNILIVDFNEDHDVNILLNLPFCVLFFHGRFVIEHMN